MKPIRKILDESSLFARVLAADAAPAPDPGRYIISHISPYTVPGAAAVEAWFPDGWSRRRMERTANHFDVCGFVAVGEGRVILGHLLYRIHDLHCELLRVAVKPAWQRRGLGRAMVKKMALHSRAISGRDFLEAYVPETDLGTHLFFKACGWKAMDVHRDHCEAGIDAYRFAFLLGDLT